MIQEVIDRYKNRPGYDSERTIQRYIQACQGFKNRAPVEELMEKTGWSRKFLEKLKVWFDEMQNRNGTTQFLASEPAEQPGHRISWITRQCGTWWNTSSNGLVI